MRSRRKRRNVVIGLAGLILGGPVTARALLQPTPRQTAGPFYPTRPPLDDDNDLTRVRGRPRTAQGQIADVFGRILDQDGRAMDDVRVEIWQCDAYGRYHHPRDRGRVMDEDFQGFGHTYSDAKGNYRFRTIRPVPYPGRTPHIHIAVFPRSTEPFTTQLYVAGEPRNADDFLFNRIAPERRHMVLADFVPTGDDGTQLRAHFDIGLAGTQGTPGSA